MFRTLTLSFALLFSAAAAAQEKGGVVSPADLPATDQLRLYAAMALDGDAEWACRELDGLMKRPEMDALQGQERATTLMVVVFIYTQCERGNDALAAAKASHAAEPSWVSTFALASLGELTDDHALSTAMTLELVKRWPERATDELLTVAWRNYHALERDPAARLQFLQALFDAGFDPVDTDAGELWHALAVLHLEAGDIPAAKRVAARVLGVNQAVKMRVDRRFDPVLADAPTLGDPRIQGERFLEALAAKQASQPTAIALRIALADEMVLLGRHAEAIAYIDETLAEVESDNGRGWTSMRNRFWLMNARGRANLLMGNAQQAVEDFEMSSMLLDRGALDLPRIMLAEHLCDAGRPDDAERALDFDFGDTQFAQQVKRSISACIAARKGDAARASAVVREMQQAQQPGDEEQVVAMYLVAGDVDAAAPLFLALLRKPETRAEALMLVQKGRFLPSMPGSVAYHATLDALRARPEVAAALEQYGRVLEWDFYL